MLVNKNAVGTRLDLTMHLKFTIMFFVIGVWRSLVSRLVRVQEASGSNPDTPTKKQGWLMPSLLFYRHLIVVTII